MSVCLLLFDILMSLHDLLNHSCSLSLTVVANGLPNHRVSLLKKTNFKVYELH